MQHHVRYVNGVRLHCVEQGSGPLMLLLHGFPDFWYSWRHQIPVFSAAGYRVVAVDLRGYNQSDRPRGMEQYKLDVLTQDIALLAQALGDGAATVIGHDWGGVIAWHLAMHHCRSVRSLIILNAPHPAAFKRELSRLSSQWLRSSYALFFQLPKIPEALLSVRDYWLLQRALLSGPADNEDDLIQYLSVFRTPGALTAALNYYRAAARYGAASPELIEHPVLLLWGRRDPFLGPKLAEGLEDVVPNLQVVQFADAGHWLHLSHAEQVNQQILKFLSNFRT